MIKFIKKLSTRVRSTEINIDNISNYISTLSLELNNLLASSNSYSSKKINSHTTKVAKKNIDDFELKLVDLERRMLRVISSRDEKVVSDVNIQEAFSRERWSDICEEMGRVGKKLDMLFIISTNIEKKLDKLDK